MREVSRVFARSFAEKVLVYICDKKHNMYTFLLHFHSGLRWLILLAVVFSVVKSLMSWISKGEYGKLDNIVAASFVGMMHLQLLTGLILYFFLSPWTSNFTFNMKDETARFWSVEHIALMILAVVFAQVGRSKSKKLDDEAAKFKMQTIFFAISLLLMVAGIPWNRLG